MAKKTEKTTVGEGDGEDGTYPIQLPARKVIELPDG